jgi:hypothetical protein
MENLGTTVHERKKGQGNLWQGNKTKVMSVIPLPIIPLPMTLLDDPPPTRGDSNSRVGIQRLANNLVQQFRCVCPDKYALAVPL